MLHFIGAVSSRSPVRQQRRIGDRVYTESGAATDDDADGDGYNSRVYTAEEEIMTYDINTERAIILPVEFPGNSTVPESRETETKQHIVAAIL